MSWSLPVWSRPPGTFQLVLGYGENPPTHGDNPSTGDNPSGQAEAHLDGPKSGSEEKEDAAGGCKIRVQLEWGAGEEEEGVVLKLQSQLMMALPYPEVRGGEGRKVVGFGQSEVCQASKHLVK